MEKRKCYKKEFEINSMITERVSYLEKMRKVLEEELIKMPKGNIYVAPGNTPNCFRYYNRETKKDKPGRYLNKTEVKLKRLLAHKKYYEKLIKEIDLELMKLKKILSLKLSDSVIGTYRKLNPGIRKLIAPINIDEDAFVEWWVKQPYVGLEFREDDNSEFYSEQGERMRSKSEVLIANTLFRKGIPYKYECPVLMADGSVRYPDFTILDVKNRRIVYWEHLGKMGDIDYVITNIRKISDYKKEGIFLGKNLIITSEAGSISLGTKEIEQMIEVYLNNYRES